MTLVGSKLIDADIGPEDISISIPWKAEQDVKQLIEKEWLVTNGIGGYASSTIMGIPTRRYHGLFVPNLRAPRGRTVVIPLFEEEIETEKDIHLISGAETLGGVEVQTPVCLRDFRWEWQIPKWTFEVGGRVFEKRITMPQGQNTVYIEYRLVKGQPIQLRLRPFFTFRGHDEPFEIPDYWPFTLKITHGLIEVHPFDGAPVLKLGLRPQKGIFVCEQKTHEDVYYRIENERGLDDRTSLSSPGYFQASMIEGEALSFATTIDSWSAIQFEPSLVFDAERHRLQKLLMLAPEPARSGLAAKLVLAADQFIVRPVSRTEENVLVHASGEHVRTVIAGYHWFTDWGRDTMISLEGLTLCTGRFQEAKAILRTFSHYLKEGLLPNHFPEGERMALYNTTDATFWYFHALDRYFQFTGDRETLETLLPKLESSIEYHLKGTNYGIGVDRDDGLIKASALGYALTWMDAKVHNWVVTPRRGKPVEIQALWYNALSLVEAWSKELGKPFAYSDVKEEAYESFNSKFPIPDKGYLYDVIDGEGNDSSLRPNQIFSMSLRFPILKEEFWKPVFSTVTDKLLTPFGLRTLDPLDVNYHPRYEGNRWERDAAYHQGLVWTWLLGPYMDVHRKLYPGEPTPASFFAAIEHHLSQAGIGTISEIFDAEAPFVPRGCIAQAWSVAEVLRTILAESGPLEKRVIPSHANDEIFLTEI